MMVWTLLFAVACAGAPKTDAERRVALDKVYNRYDIVFGAVPEVDAPTLRKQLQGAEPPVLVDVRPDHERKVSVLPGAISLDAFNADRSAYAGRPVVTYCTVGVRSGIAAKKLQKDGINATNFKGSILAWTLEGAPLVTPSGAPTQQVHVYGRRWNYAAEAYEAVLTKSDGTVFSLETPD